VSGWAFPLTCSGPYLDMFSAAIDLRILLLGLLAL
jgi:hypothetical protein